MKAIRSIAFSAVAVAAVLSLAGCGGMSARDESTAIGAVLTGGSTIGTLGGAAVGGLIGNQVGKDK